MYAHDHKYLRFSVQQFTSRLIGFVFRLMQRLLADNADL